MIVSICRKRRKKHRYLLRTFGLSEDRLKSYSHQRTVGGIDLFFEREDEKEKAYSEFKEHVYTDNYLEMEDVVVELLKAKGLKLAVAESSTGGLLAARIVNVPGSSSNFLGGFVVYANELKTKLLSVEEEFLREYGAVSKEVCRAMCVGVLEETDADISLAITGIAGPAGETGLKPVGLTYVGLGTDKEVVVQEYNLKDGRNTNRFLSTQIALDMLRKFLLRGL
ncbi:MAG: CinA family protein [Aquificaceae bacterium]